MGMGDQPKHIMAYLHTQIYMYIFIYKYTLCIFKFIRHRITTFATDHIKPGQVVVLEGRHFQDFSAGDSGIVIRADAESQTCQVPRRLGFLRSARATVVEIHHD